MTGLSEPVRTLPPLGGPSNAIALAAAPGQSHLEILRRLAGIAIAGQGGARPPSSLLPPSRGEEIGARARARRQAAGAVTGLSEPVRKPPDPLADPRMRLPCRPRPGQSHLEILRRLADIAVAGRDARGCRFLSSPLQGGGREGGPTPGSAGVSPASREARTRMRAFGPPSRRDAGAPRQLTDERDREDPRPGCRTPGSTPLPTSPLPGGRREDGAARLPVRPSRAFPNGPLTPSSRKGEE